jgi:hypothetical protein
VENLIKAVSQLGPAGSVLDAIAPGLAFLDSRATVALLKGLAKAGMPLRAVEIFDHLRCVCACFTGLHWATQVCSPSTAARQPCHPPHIRTIVQTQERAGERRAVSAV